MASAADGAQSFDEKVAMDLLRRYAEATKQWNLCNELAKNHDFALVDSHLRRWAEGLHSQLLNHYMPIARDCARRIHARIREDINVEDLASGSIFGLMDAVDEYDPQCGVPFERFALRKIRAAIIDELKFVPSHIAVRRRNSDV